MGKKKKRITKNQAKKRKRRKKRKKRSSNSPVNNNITYRPPITNTKPPKGFQATSMTQAMLEYIKPIQEMIGGDDRDNLNQSMDIGMKMWNFALSKIGDKKKLLFKAEIMHSFINGLNLTEDEAKEFIEKMIQRKEYLLPEDIQPENPSTLFIRKEDKYIIPEFDYDKIKISNKPIPADKEDQKLIKEIIQMDKDISDPDNNNWDDKYLTLFERCCSRFKKWLKDKGIGDIREDMAFCVDSFLSFIYDYNHFVKANLKILPFSLIEEFFQDYLLRKVMVKPQEYTQWIPAMKLLYIFLSEKNYLNDPEKYIAELDRIEPEFIEILRERY